LGKLYKRYRKTLDNSLVEDHEYPDAIRELNDVILECAKLKHWLARRLKSDRQKIAAIKMNADASKKELG
jgi:hypothetical protein